jgi:transposase-like protein
VEYEWKSLILTRRLFRDSIEGLSRQFCQMTKIKPSFTKVDSPRRMLYLAAQRIVKHWRAQCQNWDLILSQLEIMFAECNVI